jgi:hypothetical protein
LEIFGVLPRIDIQVHTGAVRRRGQPSPHLAGEQNHSGSPTVASADGPRNPRCRSIATPDNPNPSGLVECIYSLVELEWHRGLVERIYSDLVELEWHRGHCRRVRYGAAGVPDGQVQANLATPLRARRRDRRACQRGVGTERGHARRARGSPRQQALMEGAEAPLTRA